jgi:hypothetical protein
MRINGVNQLVRRSADLVRLWEDYRGLMDQKDSKSAPGSDATPSAPEQRAQALLNPRRGAFWLLNGVLRNSSRRNTNTDKTVIPLESMTPGFSTMRRENLEAIEPIRSGLPGDGQIQTDRTSDRLIVDATSRQEPATAKKHTDVLQSKNETTDFSTNQKQAIKQRVTFILTHLRENPFYRL